MVGPRGGQVPGLHCRSRREAGDLRGRGHRRRHQHQAPGGACPPRRDAPAASRRAAHRHAVAEGLHRHGAGRKAGGCRDLVRDVGARVAHLDGLREGAGPVRPGVHRGQPRRSRARRGVAEVPARGGVPPRGRRGGREGGAPVDLDVPASPQGQERQGRRRLLRRVAEQPVLGRLPREDGTGGGRRSETGTGRRHGLPGDQLLGTRPGRARLRPAQPRSAGPAGQAGIGRSGRSSITSIVASAPGGMSWR